MSIRTRTDARKRRSYQVRLPGERARSFATRRDAERYEAKRKTSRASGGYAAAVPITLGEALEGAIRRWEVSKLPAPATVAAARARAAFWTRAGLADTRLDRLDLVTCEDAIVAYAAASPRAATGALEWFKRALRDGSRRRQAFDAELLNIPPIQTTGREGVALDLDELQLLGSWFPPEIARLPGILGSIGFRIGEALGLTDDRIDLEAGTVFVPAKMCKEKRDKLIVLAHFERALLAEQLLARPTGTRYVFPRPDGEPWSSADSFRTTIWRKATKYAARQWRERHGFLADEPTPFDLLVPHDLRHTAISSMAAGGMRPEVIAKRVGHKDGGKLILERYRHLFADEMGLQLQGYAAWRSGRLTVAVGS